MQTCLQLQWILADVWAARNTYISKYDTHATECCSAEALQYMRQALRSRIYKEAGVVQTCLQLQWLLATAGAVRQPRLLCRGATVYAASKAQPNIRRRLRSANLFAIAMASRNCGCRKATVYLQIECSQVTETALPRRYSRQALRSRIYEEISAVQTCLQLQWLLATADAARQPYISK